MQGIYLFTFKGIRVGFRPAFLVLVILLCFGVRDMVEMLMLAVSVMCGVLFHEFGHALMARHYGLNASIMLTGWGGETSHEPARNRRQDFMITLAGPVVGLIVGGGLFGIVMLLAQIGVNFSTYDRLYTFIWYMIYVNFFWGVFNLLPIRPMDGGRVFGHILSKFMKPERADDVIAVVSVLLGALILVWALVRFNLFMALVAGYFVMINFSAFWKAVTGGKSKKNAQRRVGIVAEALYEKGLVAARNREWKKLEITGHQMKKVADDASQIERSYELLTIACTNLGKYEEALEYAPRARQTDAVKRSVERCHSLCGK